MTTYKYVTLCLITLFILAMESITFYHIKNNKHDRAHLTLFIYGTSLVVLLMEVFSFLLGPISTIEYLKVLTGKTPSGFLKYGLLYYLIPRVIVQSFKVPLESSLLVTII
ncbi:MAG: hypothetical protein K2L48_00010 [Mycoplasmoidaceae bacterium]|nr:hypothetical protein [Mycoplasmoidaceae bacterium]